MRLEVPLRPMRGMGVLDWAMSRLAITSSGVSAVGVDTCEPSTDAKIWNALLTPVVLVWLSLTEDSGGLSRSCREASSGSDA